jgi:hypothetical protein
MMLTTLLRLRPQSIEAEFQPSNGIGRIALQRTPTPRPFATAEVR